MTETIPAVTVLMTVYNGLPFLGEAVQSILDQTFRNFEFIIIDDGSTDGTSDCLERLAAADDRIIVIRQPNGGAAAAANAGLARARGAIVVRLDADDVAVPERIERQLAYLTINPKVAAVGSAIQYIDENGQPRGVSKYSEAPDDVRHNVILGQSPMAHPAVAMRRGAVLSVGGYRPIYKYAEDLDLWQRLSEKFDLANMPNVLTKYRVHDTNVTKTHFYEQTLSAHISRLAFRERRADRPDPTNALDRLDISTFGLFNLADSERTALLTHLCKVALDCHEQHGNPQHIARAEEAFFAMPLKTGRDGRHIAWRLTKLLAAKGEMKRARLVAGSVAAAHTRVITEGRFKRRAIGAKGAAIYDRDIHRCLVTYADPLGNRCTRRLKTLGPEGVLALARAAQAHGVLPAVLRNLPDYVHDPDYAAVMQEAANLKRMTFSFSTMLRFHGEALMTDLGDLPATIVKGRTFARLIYPEPSLRGYTDIDLLVAPPAVPKVQEVLRAQGFAFAETGHDPRRMEEKWVHRENQVLVVEIHTNMVHHPGLRKVMSLAYDDFEGQPESPAALLTIASMHAGLHQFEKLQQMVDICQAARALTTRDQERRYIELIEKAGGRLAAIAGLRLAHRIFKEPRCREIADALGPERHTAVSALLVSPSVVVSTMGAQRPMHSWRRKLFRDLLKRRKAERRFTERPDLS